MRTLVLCTILMFGCSDRKLAPDAPPSYRFLPASPDVVVRVDLVRARAWPQFTTVATAALAGVQRVIEDTKRVCSLDVLAEASAVVLARRGDLLGGDVTLIISGLAKAKITACFTSLSTASETLKLTIDGDLVHATVAGKKFASAAILSTGELVLVMRAGQSVEPLTWKAEVENAKAAAPTWVRELDANDPIAARVVVGDRTVTANVKLGDPLVVRGKVVTASEAAAKEDVKRMNAILSYLGQGQTGTGRIEPSGAVIHADFTAKGAEIEAFVKTALPALFGAGIPRDVATEAVTGPKDCSSLGAAVSSYLETSLGKATESQRKELEAAMGKLLPELKKAYVDSCTADAWAQASIECHVSNSTGLARFEKCRETLTDAQRESLDTKLKIALDVGTRVDMTAPPQPPTPTAR